MVIIPYIFADPDYGPELIEFQRVAYTYFLDYEASVITMRYPDGDFGAIVNIYFHIFAIGINKYGYYMAFSLYLYGNRVSILRYT